MPNFSSPFTGMELGRKLTDEELIKAVRFVVAAEYEAVQMYMQIAEATDNELAKEVLISVSDEERVHAGEFLELLFELSPDEKQFYAEGSQEVQDMVTSPEED